MTYNCETPRGITLRTAPAPTGPWSARQVIFEPWADRGYLHFMHGMAPDGHDDGLAERGREDSWGGEYGPYLVPQWFESSGGLHHIVYLLSSWNPYQVHLMRTTLGEPGVTFTPPVKGAGLPPAMLQNADFSTGTLAGWQSSGDGFTPFVDGSGRWALTTYVAPKGDGVVGQLWQDFTVDANTAELRFWVHGGDAAVKLLRGPDTVRTTRGRRTNDVETLVRWQLAECRGQTLPLLIDDSLTAPWGFISVRGFQFQ